MRPAAIVLAGGASSRFGADKLAADLDGRPVLQHTVEAVAAVASPVVLVLAPDAAVPPWVGPPGPSGASVVIARDPEPLGGPLVGLAAGLAALRGAAPGAELALVAGGDMPSLVPGVLDLLAATLDSDPDLGATTLEADPAAMLPMAVRVEPVLAACGTILAGHGKRSLRAMLAAIPKTVVSRAAWSALDPDAATLRDIDIPADLPGRP